MENNFEKEIDSFIEFLKNFKSEKIKRKIFNPWKDEDSNDAENASLIRRENLKKHLLDNENADVILIAESPSKGARYTGIAMTSEVAIKKYNLCYQYSSFNHKKTKKGESTASKVWSEITKSNKKIVLWNAFAFNINEKEDKWFENPTKEELIENLCILEKFLKLFPKAQIVAVGQTAKIALDNLKEKTKECRLKNFNCVRHPSNDFKKEFPEQIKKFL